MKWSLQSSPNIVTFATLFAFAIGCGESSPKMVTVKGHVLIDGTGVTAGAVYFHPDAANEFQSDTPGSQLQIDGSFSVKTFPFGEGVPPGTYKVTLSPELANRMERPDYGVKEKTPWEVVVPDAPVEDLKLELPTETTSSSL
jgi:hypothetical protein